jgi:2-dehydro-3-deoxyphosphooctonate aldolase (KDO 8-P synthase)
MTTIELAGRVIGNSEPMFLIAGPCVIESPELTFETASRLVEIAKRCGVFLVFKSSFDKANRTSRTSFRGPGLEKGLAVLERVRTALNVPVLTDVHDNATVDEVASVVDVLQTPAFLARQTDFIERVARTHKPMNVKKAQFMAPSEMVHVVDKCRSVGNLQVMLCERGACFGYNELVADMRSLAALRRTGCPVIFDATHSVQKPGHLGSASGGDRAMAAVLARSAVAAGVAGIFMETHLCPDQAMSDGPNMWPVDLLEELLRVLVELDRIVKATRFIEAAVDGSLVG